MGILESLKAKTPTLWRNVARVAISLKVSCLAILGINAVTPLPEKLVTASGWIAGICLIIVTYSETRVEKTTSTNSNPDNSSTDSK